MNGIQRKNINEHLPQHNTQSISIQRTISRISKYSSKIRNGKVTQIKVITSNIIGITSAKALEVCKTELIDTFPEP
jgi:hypothetical protein